MEMPVADTPVNALATHPEVEQLPPRHHAELSPRKLGHRPIPLASR
jgi:hypothetical protein